MKQWRYWRQSYNMYNQRYLGIKGAIEGEKDEKATMEYLVAVCSTNDLDYPVVEASDVQLCNA